MRQLVILGILCLLLSVSGSKVCRLSVFSPPELVESLRERNKGRTAVGEENSIDCELANFGSIQYGTRTIGELHLSTPFNAC